MELRRCTCNSHRSADDADLYIGRVVRLALGARRKLLRFESRNLFDDSGILDRQCFELAWGALQHVVPVNLSSGLCACGAGDLRGRSLAGGNQLRTRSTRFLIVAITSKRGSRSFVQYGCTGYEAKSIRSALSAIVTRSGESYEVEPRVHELLRFGDDDRSTDLEA